MHPRRASGTHSSLDPTRASLLYLRPHSPDFSPIENAFAMLKREIQGPARVGSGRNEKGELVCTKSFSSMPLMFWAASRARSTGLSA